MPPLTDEEIQAKAWEQYEARVEELKKEIAEDKAKVEKLNDQIFDNEVDLSYMVKFPTRITNDIADELRDEEDRKVCQSSTAETKSESGSSPIAGS